MAELRDVIAYICDQYPHKHELSNARVTKMVYLADWRKSLLFGEQMTPIQWQFHHYGPFVDDVLDTASNDPGFSIDYTTNMLGERKALVSVDQPAQYPSLSRQDKEVLDFVIEKTGPLYWKPFIRLVYSTYPVATQQRYDHLNLPLLAEEARQLGDLFDEPAA